MKEGLHELRPVGLSAVAEDSGCAPPDVAQQVTEDGRRPHLIDRVLGLSKEQPTPRGGPAGRRELGPAAPVDQHLGPTHRGLGLRDVRNRETHSRLQTPLRRDNVRLCLIAGPAAALPALNGAEVLLPRLTARSFPGEPVCIEDLPRPHVRAVHPPPLGQHLGQPICDPKIGVIPERLGAPSEQLRQGPELLAREARRSSGAGLGVECVNPSLRESARPLADRLRSHTEAVGRLGPTHAMTKQFVPPKSAFLQGRSISVPLSPAPHVGRWEGH